jgi:hypothetical protein
LLTLPVIPGRDCGGCTVCCTALPVDEPALRKQANVDCPQCDVGGGCRVYDRRPQTCREFFCGWRALPKLGDEWRPDRSGVMVTFDDQDIPPGYPIRPAFKLVLTNGPVTLDTDHFAGYVAGLIVAKIPVFLSLRGPPGHFFAKAFLNDRLAWPVQNRDRGAIVAALEAVYALLESGDFDPIILSGPPISP